MALLPDKSLAGIILAAGGSRRLGQPKQLCEWQGKPLVCHAAEASLAVCGAGVIVVTGSHALEVEAALRSCKVKIVRNQDWETGMSGSLQAGVDKLQGRPAGVLVALCDQPLLAASDLARLVNAWQASTALPAAAKYSGIVGVPAIIPDTLLDAVMSLQGDAGARSLLDTCPTVNPVDMPSAAFDIDTIDDLNRLRAGQ